MSFNPQWRWSLFLIVSFVASFGSRSLASSGALAQETVATDFESLANSAASAREAGNSDQAIRDYRRAVEIRPDWEEGWWYLGTLQYDSDHFADAIPTFKKVVELDSALGPAWNFLGLCEFETHDYESSLQNLQKARDLGTGDDPEVARVSAYHLALLLNRRGDFSKAFSLLTSTFADHTPTDVRAALGLSLLRIPLLPQEVDPSQDALLQSAGETASILGRADPAKTVEAFRALLKQYPETPYLHYAFGIALSAAGRNEEALLQQEQEVKISPASELPYLEITSLQLRMHHPQDALRAARTAVRVAPNSAAAHRALSQGLQAAAEKDKSATELKAAEALPAEYPERERRMVERYARRATESPEVTRATPNPNGPSAANFDELSRKATAAEAGGHSSDAIGIYEQALQLRPDWDEGRWHLAMLAYSAGNYSEAITSLKACVARQPNNGTAWAVMGMAEFDTKDYDNARIHLERGQALGLSGSAESVQLAKYRLAILLNLHGEFDRATDLLVSESATGTRAQEIQFALGMSLLRMPRLPWQVEASKTSLVRGAGEIAPLLQQSKYDEAFPKFDALLKQYPTAPFLHYVYGTALAALSQYDDAESQLRQEVSISPKSELPYLRLASIALKTHRPADAVIPAQRSVELASDSAEAHYLLGRSYLELGQKEKALMELERASSLAPSSPEVHFNLAKAYAKANLPEKAEQERATFARLNALAEEQRSHHGSQSYSGSHDPTDVSVHRAESGAPAPEAHQ